MFIPTNSYICIMKTTIFHHFSKIAALVVALCAACGASAQNYPIGIVSHQDSMRYVQFGLVANIADSYANGVQFSPITNMSAAPFRGIQLSAISNIAMGVEKGIQLGGALNVSSGYMRGIQLAAANYADSLNGSQIGLINVALAHPRGWQVGIVNVTRDTLAHKIGLVNINAKTTIDYMFSAGSSTKFNAAVRYRNRSTYNILGAGTHYMGLDRDFSGAIYYRIGQYFHLTPRLTLSGDVGFYHIETFQHKADKPERLYSIQARINADYQLGKYLGAFVSVGYGDTRYYSHNRHYRNRPLIEAGLTIRHQRSQPQDIFDIRRNDDDIMDRTDSIMALPLKPKPWRAAVEATGINVFVHCFDRFVLGEEFAKTTLNSIGHNIRNGFVWDNDQFSTNLFAHPYHGNLYYNAARSNGLNFWQSAPYSFFGSLMWEVAGEKEPPAINDLIATTMGGICIGEVTHRVSDIILDDRAYGFPRFLREAAATIINPIKGLNRIITGEAWRVRSTHYLHHEREAFPLDCSISVGDRYLADNGAIFRGEHNPYVNLFMEYGDAMDGENHNKPYDFFSAEVTFGLSKNQPLINSLHILGRLWSAPFNWGKSMDVEFGIYQHFNYYDSKPVKNGSDLTPYRISEAASVGPGVIVEFPKVGALTRLEQRIFLSGILLGGTKSDYFNVIDRDYNMGSGYSIKAKTHMEIGRFGRFILNVHYFRIFTWKGYENKDLSTIDPLYLNAQGDKGNAHLLVVSPMIEIDLPKRWSLLMASSFFERQTHYKYYADVKAKTFEVRAGLTYHF